MKIVIIILLILLTVNTAIAEEQKFTLSYDHSITDISTETDFQTICMKLIHVDNFDNIKGVNFIQCKPDVWYGDTTRNSQYVDVVLYSDLAKTVNIGSGIAGYTKYQDGYYRMQLFIYDFDETLTGAGIIVYDESLFAGGAADIYVKGSTVSGFGTNHIRYGDKTAVMSFCPGGEHHLQYRYEFENTVIYNYNSTYEKFDFKLIRNSTNPSKAFVDTGYIELFNETSLVSVNTSTTGFNLTNCNWNVTITDMYYTNITHYLDYCSLMQDPTPDDEPTIVITTQPIESGDSITISYTNLDYIRLHASDYGYDYYAADTFEVVMYEIEGTGLTPVYNEILTSDNDGNIVLDSSIYDSGKLYGVCITTTVHRYYYGCANAIINTTFTIYSDLDEYVNIYEDNLYTCDEVYLYYKCINESNIKLLDNDDNIILSWLNKQGEGLIGFNIPMDSDSINTYPNWKINMSDNDNVTNYHNDSFTVYWKICEYPVDEPEEYPTPPDEDIQDNIDELKDGLGPLKELVFGLTTIFIDNPDENNNNIIDTDEIGNFFNGLIPWAILIFIFIVYQVIRRK